MTWPLLQKWTHTMASSENCAAAASAEDEFNSPDLLMSRSLTVSKTTLKWTLGMGRAISINAFFKTILTQQYNWFLAGKFNIQLSLLTSLAMTFWLTLKSKVASWIKPKKSLIQISRSVLKLMLLSSLCKWQWAAFVYAFRLSLW